MPKRIHYDPHSHQQTISDCSTRKIMVTETEENLRSSIPRWSRDNRLTGMYQVAIIILFLVALILSIGR